MRLIRDGENGEGVDIDVSYSFCLMSSDAKEHIRDNL